MTTAMERSKAIPPDPSLPTLQEELDRKALEAIERLLQQYSDGLMNERDLKLATRTLFDTVSGLVDRGIIDLISKVGELPHIPGRVSLVRRLTNGDKLALIERSLDNSAVTITVIDTSAGYVAKSASFGGELSPNVVALGYVERTVEKFKEKGFEEV